MTCKLLRGASKADLGLEIDGCRRPGVSPSQTADRIPQPGASFAARVRGPSVGMIRASWTISTRDHHRTRGFCTILIVIVCRKSEASAVPNSSRMPAGNRSAKGTLLWIVVTSRTAAPFLRVRLDQLTAAAPRPGRGSPTRFLLRVGSQGRNHPIGRVDDQRRPSGRPFTTASSVPESRRRRCTAPLDIGALFRPSRRSLSVASRYCAVVGAAASDSEDVGFCP